MNEPKYKVGDRVKIKNLEYYNKYKNRYGDINYGCETEILFTSEMSSFCGQVITITRVLYIGCVRFYHIAEDKGVHLWVAGMFEGIVEEENLIEKSDDFGVPFDEWLFHQNTYHLPYPFPYNNKEVVEKETKPKYEDEMNGEYYSTPKYLVRPSGYQFVDENDNIINANKIILKKKH